MRAMSESSGTAVPAGLGEAVYEQILDLWVEPELRRREVSLDPRSIKQALVLMHPDEEVKVLIDGQAEIIGDFVPSRPIEAGQPVMLDDIEELRGFRPLSVDGDAGWVLFVWVGSSLYVAFDFRRNRAKAQQLLELARNFERVAASAADEDLVQPAIVNAFVNAFVAAELAVKAHMLVFSPQSKKTGHAVRQRWIAKWTHLGNAPRADSWTLGRLAELQKGAR